MFSRSTYLVVKAKTIFTCSSKKPCSPPIPASFFAFSVAYSNLFIHYLKFTAPFFVYSHDMAMLSFADPLSLLPHQPLPPLCVVLSPGELTAVWCLTDDVTSAGLRDDSPWNKSVINIQFNIEIATFAIFRYGQVEALRIHCI